ncbi:MAG: hypothetical protein IT342_05735 [Candidatus Melainabacteria bacterium]|nr:hypothetical protein [Candidatus Melainabacteria bacterium]
MSTAKCKQSRAWGIFASILLLTGLAAGQQMSSAQNTPSSYRQKPYPIAQEENHKLDQLRDKVDLPDLPSYTGKAKFVSGTVEQGAKGGPRYSMVFESEEPQSQVIDWYDNVFRMYKWNGIQKSTSSVSANHKEGHYASISSDAVVRTGVSSPKIHSSFTVHYQMAVR